MTKRYATKLRLFVKGPPLNQSGMALGTALFACIILGAVTIYILDIGQNKRKIQDNITVTVSADNVKNKLISTLNSKPSWDLTTANNNIYPLAAPGSTPINSANPPKINVYDAETGDIAFNSTNQSTGFDSTGAPCDTFNASEGNDSCPFRYVVSVKSVTNNAGQYTVITRSDLTFKARSSKFVFNSKKEKYSFDYTVGIDQTAAENICVAIGGIFNQTSNTCTKKLTISASCANFTESYQGQAPGAASACAVTQLAQQTCPSSQYLYGYDPNEHTILCRNF